MFFKDLITLYYQGNIINHVLFNFVLTLFKRSVKIYKLRHKKNMLPERFCLIKKNVIYKEIIICKEKAGTITKVKLVTKIKKHNQLYFGTLVLLLWR